MTDSTSLGVRGDTDSYQRLLGRLAELTARVDAQRAEADDWYDSRCAAAERAVREATRAVRLAEEELRAAREEAEAIDAEVAHLWQALRERLGLSPRRIGPPPAPQPGAPADPQTLLDAVRDLLERTKRPGELPRSTTPLLAVFGILGAAVASLVGFAIRAAGARHGGDLAVGLPVLSLVVTLLGPVTGLAPAKVLADRRHAVLGPRPVAVVLIAGVVTTGLLFAVLR
ncbi:MAG TPA: hypothetical protein VGD43_17535 [Micromonospora sp.]